MRRSSRWTAVLFLVALTATACTIETKSAPTTSSTATTTATSTTRGSTDGDPSVPSDSEVEARVQALLEDVQGAIEVTDTFWTLHWSDYFTDSYVSPTVNDGYLGSENPPCGGQIQDGSGNAYYCPDEDYIDWDWYLFVDNYGDDVIGDSFVYAVIAHEWAHAIQARLDASLVSLAAELQADCLAAATLVGAVADGTLVFEPGDRGEVFQSFVAVADEVEWGDVDAHGSADERIEAYQLGESGGVTACLAG